MGKPRKINRENYDVVREYSNSHTLLETSLHFGISQSVISRVRQVNSYDEYLEQTAELAREAYNRRQREKAADTKRHFNKIIKVGAPSNDGMFHESKTKIYGSPFSETTIKEGADGSRTIVTKPVVKTESAPQNYKKVHMLEPTEMYRACEMAMRGETHAEIARTLGFDHVGQFLYALKKSDVDYAKYRRAYESGAEARAEASRERLAKIRDKARAEGKLVSKRAKKTPQEKAVITAAKNRGMTVEEYKEYQKENLAKARAAKVQKEIDEYKAENKAEESKTRVEVAKENLQKELDNFDDNVKHRLSLIQEEKERLVEVEKIKDELKTHRAYRALAYMLAGGFSLFLVLASIAILITSLK